MIVLFTCGPMFAYSMLSVGRLGGKRFVRVIDVKQNPTAPSSAAPSYATYYCLSQHPACSHLFVNNNCTLLALQLLICNTNCDFLVKRNECWKDKVVVVRISSECVDQSATAHQVEPTATDMSFAKSFVSA